MDIDLDEMGLIGCSTEFIQDIGDSSVIYSQDGTINISSDALSSYGNRVTYVTVPNNLPIVQIIQDGSSQNIGYIINNNQLPTVNQPIILTNENLVDLADSSSTSKENGGEVLPRQLSDYLASDVLNPCPDDEVSTKDTAAKLVAPVNENQDVDPPDKTGKMSCDKCQMEFNSWKWYRRHKLLHLHEKPFQCSACGESFNYELNLVLHSATHNVDKPYCPICKKYFSRIASLKAHVMLHEQEESLFCQECGDEFASPVYLQRHMVEHRTGKVVKQKKKLIKMYKCKFCDKTFDSAATYKLHRIKIHKILHNRNFLSMKQRANTCEYCKKGFEKPSQLLRHRRIHTGERPYKCHICSRAFIQKGSLQIHMLKHTREKPYVCQFCHGEFSQKGNLQAHIKRLHAEPNENETVYKCDLCTCIFRRQGSLHAHLAKIHWESFPGKQVTPCKNGNGEKVDSLSDSSNKENESLKKENGKSLPVTTSTDSSLCKPGEEARHETKERALLCSYCSKEFKRPGDLIRHIRCHTLEKPFACNVCGKCFPMQSTLTMHLKTHQSKRFMCLTCRKCYSSSQTLNLHMRKHVVEEDSSKTKEQNNVGDVTCGVPKKPINSGDVTCRVLQKPINTGDVTCGVLQKSINAGDVTCRVPQKSNNAGDVLSLDQTVIASLDNVNIILTEGGNIVAMNSDVGDEYGSVKGSYKCKECSMVFTKEDQLSIHIQTHIKSLQTFYCELCPCTFNSKNTLTSHLNQYHPLKKFTCNECRKEFTSESSLKRHIKTHVEGFPWTCPLCSWTFKTFKAACKHVKIVHPSSNKDIKPILKLAMKKTVVDNEAKNEKDNESKNEKDSESRIEKPELDTCSVENPLPTAVINQEVDASSDLNALLTLLPNHFLLIANEEGSYHIFPKPNSQREELQEFSVYQESDIILNSTETNSVVKPISDNSLETCIFPVQPGMESGNSILSDEVTTDIVPINRCGVSTLLVSNVADFPIEKTSHLEKPHTCISCDKSFSSAIEYEEHLKLHKKQATQPVISENESLNFSYASQTQTDLFSCNECHLNFATFDELTNHQGVHINPEMSKNAFDFGNAQFVILPETPTKTKAPSKEVIQCFICLAETNSVNEFQTHCLEYHEAQIKLMLGNDKKKPRVNWRPPARRLTEEETKALSTILPDNTSEKILLESLREKERFEHPPVKEEPPKPAEVHRHKCKYCDKSFRKPSDLIRHLRTHTGEKPYKCNACNKRFSIKSAVACHMKTHSKDQSYQCYVCSKLFSSPGSLKIHMRLHTGLKPFSCDLCDAKFRTSGHKKAHLSKHHKRIEEIPVGPVKINDDDPNRDIPMDIWTVVHSSSNPINQKTDDFLTAYKLSENEVPKESPTKISKLLLNINDEGGGNGHTPRYFLSIKDGGTGEDGFVLDSVNDDQIIVTITKGDSGVSKPTQQQEEVVTENLESPLEQILSCTHCHKTFSKQINLEKHIKKFHPKETHQCSVCFVNFEKKSDLDFHLLAHELDQGFTCPECSECFFHEEELRAHKCSKSVSIDLSLDHDLFLFS